MYFINRNDLEWYFRNRQSTLHKSYKMTDWEGLWSRDGGLQPGQKFDATQPLPFLTKVFEKKLIPQGFGLVPGCGRGYAVGAFASQGNKVVGLELSKTAADAARTYLNNNCSSKKELWKIDEGSFFEYNAAEKFDFAYDYTFLCALDPDQREAWAQKYAELLKQNCKLMTVVFPIGGLEGIEGGPPYALSVKLVENLLLPHGFKKEFEQELVEGEAHPGREGKTTFCIWSR